MRYVSCRDNQGGVAEESACAHLPKPPAREVCTVVACGQWKVLEWTVVRKLPVIFLYSRVSEPGDPYIVSILQQDVAHTFTVYGLTQCCRGQFQISGNMEKFSCGFSNHFPSDLHLIILTGSIVEPKLCHISIAIQMFFLPQDLFISVYSTLFFTYTDS